MATCGLDLGARRGQRSPTGRLGLVGWERGGARLGSAVGKREAQLVAQRCGATALRRQPQLLQQLDHELPRPRRERMARKLDRPVGRCAVPLQEGAKVVEQPLLRAEAMEQQRRAAVQQRAPLVVLRRIGRQHGRGKRLLADHLVDALREVARLATR